jgi:hypothetical protein
MIVSGSLVQVNGRHRSFKSGRGRSCVTVQVLGRVS